MKFRSFNQKFLMGIIFGLMLGVFGSFLYYSLYKARASQQSKPDPVIRIGISNSDYKFIRPLLGYDYNPQDGFPELKNFQGQLQNLINQLQAKQPQKNISLYFRDFSSGHWLDINQQNKFYPASLLKVPLMMAIFRQAETSPQILSQRLIFDGKEDANNAEVYKAQDPIKPGQAYTVDELIQKMIVDSDNNATNVLVYYLDQIQPAAFDKIYKDFGITLPDPAHSDEDFLKPHDYALFLRVLRNATYLNQEYSEKALELLSQVNFKNGLIAGIPADVPVIHKFGEALSPQLQQDGSQLDELHDCGIIYLPQHNYMLCVMAKGKSFDELSADIKNISQFVYEQVNKNYK